MKSNGRKLEMDGRDRAVHNQCDNGTVSIIKTIRGVNDEEHMGMSRVQGDISFR